MIFLCDKIIDNRGDKMKKNIVYLVSFATIFLLLLWNTQESKQLTRVDYKDRQLTEEDKLLRIEDIFKEIEWQDYSVEFTREEDLKAKLFYRINGDPSTVMYDYQMWFNQMKGEARIYSSNIYEGYGKLDKNNSDKLKREFSE